MILFWYTGEEREESYFGPRVIPENCENKWAALRKNIQLEAHFFVLSRESFSHNINRDLSALQNFVDKNPKEAGTNVRHTHT